MDYQAKTDWTYNDTVTEQDMNRIEAGLGDLHQRLDTPATSELVLQPGTQTIQVARDTPFHLKGIFGRMLLNLLGRNGNCESLNGWVFSGTGTLNTSQFVIGTASIQITAGSGGGIISRNVELKAGKTYVLAASIKLGTATGAAVSITGIVNGSVVTSSSNFATSYMRFTATSSTHTVAIVLQATQGQTAYVDAIRLYEISAAEYSQLGNMTTSKVEQTYPYTEGLCAIKKPYAIRWTSAAKTNVAAMLALDTELLAPPVPADDAERDRLEQGVDGQYYKMSNHYRYSLTGANINVITSANYSGYKWIRLQLPVAPIKDTGYMIKFDGSVISRVNQGVSPSKPDQHVVLDSTDSVPNSVLVTVANSDSGWGEDYVPSIDEIKAYFYGWVMGTQASSGTFTIGYNKTGTKAWRGLVNDTGSGTVDLPKTYFQDQYSQPDWKPYEIVYKRASVFTEPVVSEGSLSLIKEENIVEVGSGLILRETAKPVSGDGTNYYINARATFAASALTYNSIRPLLIYRNGLLDTWGQNNEGDSFGSRQAALSGNQFDKTASYAVTYFARNTFPASVFPGTISINERATLDNLIRDVQQATRRVSVVESKKADQNYPIWLVPTLLNGWMNTSSRQPLQYRKKDGMVMIRGEIKSGTVGAVIFRLPTEYRPKYTAKYAVNCWSGSAVVGASLIIYPTGEVLISDGNNNEIGLGTVIFAID
ncbi:hypothetical protein [Paenibacillus wenxiniae]|uniref:Carbohydrate binding domain-containing protein n=1 Tax=Paenibacillus wenxiniae TaxID=1636843 RepID=A0ABW4RHX1_9BACL